MAAPVSGDPSRDRGEQRVDTVLTFLGELEAVAMSVEAHAGGWFGPKKTWGVYSVSVEDLGPAPRTKDGTVWVGPSGYLDDRSEF